MEIHSSVKSGVRKFPPGFRFHPTDQELLLHYLKRKAFSRPLPASIIPEFDVCKSNPWELPGETEEEMYFFSIKEAKYPSGNRTNRATSRGYWKATGKDRQVVACKGNQVIGMKKTLVFYKGRAPHGIRTDWIMHEYRLTSSVQTKPESPSLESSTTITQSSKVPIENWVLCRVFLKKRGYKNGDEDMNSSNEIVASKPGMSRPVLHDFLRDTRVDLNVAPSSSSGSSGVTLVSSNVSDDHEETSCGNSVPILSKRP